MLNSMFTVLEESSPNSDGAYTPYDINNTKVKPLKRNNAEGGINDNTERTYECFLL